MAFVILSAGNLAQSSLHTVGIKSVVAGVAATVFLAIAGGFALGHGISSGKAEAVAESVIDPVLVDPGQAEGRMLIDRFGELAARVVQLEAEAVELATRVGVVKEFEARVKGGGPSNKSGRTVKTPIGAPTGGPLLNPIRDPEALLLDAAMSKRLGSAAEVTPAVDSSKLSDEFLKMEQGINRLAATFARIEKVTTASNLANMSFPGRAPVAEPEMTSTFGNRVDPFRKRRAFHGGVDFAASKGTPILASAGGEVVFAGYRNEYGYTVEIDHGAGLATRYAHASKLFVKRGQVVMPGQEIAAVGSTGRSTGAHLHFEIIKDGEVVDPAFYLARF